MSHVSGFFCGYGEDDYSLAWTLWGASGRHPWANHWWSFTERGVGRLTWALGEHLASDPGVDYQLRQTAHATHIRADGVIIDLQDGNGIENTVFAHAVIMAVPGTRVAGLLPDLDSERRAFFDQITYAGHHISYFMLARPKGDLPASYVLPTADGFDRSANFSFEDLGDGRTLAFSEWKDVACRRHADCSDEQLLDLAWGDFIDVIPALGDVKVIDRFLSRQPEAITKRPKGYITALKKFKDLGQLDRLAFCGDYLANSTVGSAHHTGVVAAECLLASDFRCL